METLGCHTCAGPPPVGLDRGGGPPVGAANPWLVCGRLLTADDRCFRAAARPLPACVPWLVPGRAEADLADLGFFECPGDLPREVERDEMDIRC